jgi:hypothetical protein
MELLDVVNLQSIMRAPSTQAKRKKKFCLPNRAFTTTHRIPVHYDRLHEVSTKQKQGKIRLMNPNPNLESCRECGVGTGAKDNVGPGVPFFHWKVREDGEWRAGTERNAAAAAAAAAAKLREEEHEGDKEGTGGQMDKARAGAGEVFLRALVPSIHRGTHQKW